MKKLLLTFAILLSTLSFSQDIKVSKHSGDQLIVSSDSKDISVSIYDATGRLTSFTNGEEKISIEIVGPIGLYTYFIESGGERISGVTFKYK